MRQHRHLAFILIVALGVLGMALGSCRAGKGGQTVAVGEIRLHIVALADSMSSDGAITTQFAARLPGETPAYRRRHTLMREATTEELLQLYKHEHPVVRIAAFEGLYRRDYLHLNALFTHMVDEDDSQMHYIRGDISMPMPTLEYTYSYVLGLPLPEKGVPAHREPILANFRPTPEVERRAAERIGDLRTLR